jgi:hypothetical protein
MLTFIVGIAVVSVLIFVGSLLRIKLAHGDAGVPLWEVVVMFGAQMVLVIVAFSYLYAVGMAA